MFLMDWVRSSRRKTAVKKLSPMADQVIKKESFYQALSDFELKDQLDQHLLSARKGEPLDNLLVPVFAIVREASFRTLGMKHFHSQIVGGIALHQGHIIEMGTGEGKTLVATLPSVLNALLGKGVHIVTVNDYLAKRDAEWMRPCYEFLGLSVGYVLSEQPYEEKKKAYDSDIIYANNNELGFDYLRDHLVYDKENLVGRGRAFAIVDEVDSVLIDEARTPLAISGEIPQDIPLYQAMRRLVLRLEEQPYFEMDFSPIGQEKNAEALEDTGDYMHNEAFHSVELTDRGFGKIELLFKEEGLLKEDESLYRPDKANLLHYLMITLRAKVSLKKDVDYLVLSDSIVLIDENTGRPLKGRRFGEGLHQALEIKEGVSVQNETKTLASISFQNYFRGYQKLAGMTGTALTELEEFSSVYGLDVRVIPPNKTRVRIDKEDAFYVDQNTKHQAILKEVKTANQKEQPVLLGTASVAHSQEISNLLSKEGIKHVVLNAKNHTEEAKIIAQAGKVSSITVVTNMAGRGVDIVLGGNLEETFKEESEKGTLSKERVEQLQKEHQLSQEKVKSAGGLYVIGSERHESRRVDNQLRGRSGRQGDPGKSRFFLSLDDPLIRVFAGEKTRAWLQRLNPEPGVPLEHKIFTRSIEKAQRKIEGQNYDARKALIEMDNVVHEQRNVIYQDRERFLNSKDLTSDIEKMASFHLSEKLSKILQEAGHLEHINANTLSDMLEQIFFIQGFDLLRWIEKQEKISPELLEQSLLGELNSLFRFLFEKFDGADIWTQIQRRIVLESLDQHWRDHLEKLTRLRQNIGLRGYAQKDPKQEYKKESFKLFGEMVDKLWDSFFAQLTHLAHSSVQLEPTSKKETSPSHVQSMHKTPRGSLEDETPPEEETVNSSVPIRRSHPKVGRNEPCPCGSGKKYKHCHGS